MSIDTKVKFLVKDQTAEFTAYTDGNLWYRIPDKNFDFPIPIEETKGGNFPRSMRAIFLMRWIRKQLMVIEGGEQEEEE